MIIAAIPVGFCAGLFGIGGGLISVPFLFFIFDTLIIDKQYIFKDNFVKHFKKLLISSNRN